MSAKIYIEGGGSSNESKRRCREAFSKLLGRCGFAGRKPRLVACGGRQTTFDDFCIKHQQDSAPGYVALLVDSEEPVADVEQPWEHLARRDGWLKPAGATTDQALLMVVCMETWIAADRVALRRVFGPLFRENALPPLHALESKSRQEIFESLKKATAECPGKYGKGDQSFKCLAELSPDTLQHLTSFVRFQRVLSVNL